MERDYYDILQVRSGATSSEIKTAYRRLALRYHPDKNASSLAEEKFKRINEAYDVLMDETKKAAYDKNRIRSSFSYSSFDSSKKADFLKRFTKNFNEQFKDFKDYFSPSDFDSFCFKNPSPSYCRPASPTTTFNQLFGDFLNSPTTDPFNSSSSAFCQVKMLKDPDFTQEVPLTLEEVLYGKEKMVAVTTKTSQSGVCVDKSKVYKIDVKKGWCAGTRVTFSQEGTSLDRCHTPGDLVFVTVDQPHPLFIRDGVNIRYKVAISLEEALCGTTITIPTLDQPTMGQQLTISDVIKPTTTKVLQGRGLPFLRHPDRRGDLVVEFDIRFPDIIEPGDKQILVGCLRR